VSPPLAEARRRCSLPANSAPNFKPQRRMLSWVTPAFGQNQLDITQA
jgi:hypothetical protein